MNGLMTWEKKMKKKDGGSKIKHMKKLMTLVPFLFLSILALAQRPQGQSYDKEKLEAARIAYITNRIDLSPEQAEKFWPIYNKFQEERNQILEQLSGINRSSMAQDLSDTKAKELIERKLKLQQQALDLEKNFYEDIIKVIQPVQALKMGNVNRDFTRQVYHMQQNRGKPKNTP